MTAKRNVSIRMFLLGLLITEILAIVRLTWLLWFQNGQRAVAEVEAHLRDEISARIAQRIDDFLSLPDRINQINEDAYRRERILSELLLSERRIHLEGEDC